jgi:HK97 family phage portal protein
MGFWDLFGGGGDVAPRVYTGSNTSWAGETDLFQLPTVVAGRQIISDTVASFPMVARDATSGLVVDPTPSICSRPDPRETSYATFGRIVNNMTRYGNAWIHTLTNDAAGYPLAVEVIANKRIGYTFNGNGTRFSEITIDGQSVPLGDVGNIPMILDGDGILGRSPLNEIRPALEQLASAMDFSGTYYSTAALPPYALISPTRLSEGKSKELLDAWTLARTENRPAVISGDLSLKTFTPTSASDALVLEAIKYLDATVARVLGLPPSILATEALSSLTYSTVQQELARWLVNLNATYLTRIESFWSDMMPRTRFAEFDTANLTKLNQTEQLQHDTDALAAGIVTIDEVRASRGLEPLTDVALPEPVAPSIV